MLERDEIEHNSGNCIDQWEIIVLLSFHHSLFNMAYNFAIMLPPPVLNLFCSQVEIKAPSRSLFIEPCR
jgi:hypothetical protein